MRGGCVGTRDVELDGQWRGGKDIGSQPPVMRVEGVGGERGLHLSGRRHDNASSSHIFMWKPGLDLFMVIYRGR